MSQNSCCSYRNLLGKCILRSSLETSVNSEKHILVFWFLFFIVFTTDFNWIDYRTEANTSCGEKIQTGFRDFPTKYIELKNVIYFFCCCLLVCTLFFTFALGSSKVFCFINLCLSPVCRTDTKLWRLLKDWSLTPSPI